MTATLFPNPLMHPLLTLGNDTRIHHVAQPRRSRESLPDIFSGGFRPCQAPLIRPISHKKPTTPCSTPHAKSTSAWWVTRTECYCAADGSHGMICRTG